MLQALNEDDPDRRLEFCQWILDSTQEDPTILDRILWTNEATFQTNGRVSRKLPSNVAEQYHATTSRTFSVSNNDLAARRRTHLIMFELCAII